MVKLQSFWQKNKWRKNCCSRQKKYFNCWWLWIRDLRLVIRCPKFI